jgi:hypothetical protein
LGDGVPKLALGGPPGGVPGADPSSGPYYGLKPPKHGPGGVLGGPRGGPGGGAVGPWGPRGGSGGPSRGVTPRGAPWWPPSLRTILPFWSRPPGGHFWGVRTRWGQNQAMARSTGVYRGGRGAPPKAHWVRSLQGGPKRAQFEAFVGVFTPRLRSLAPCLSLCFSVFLSIYNTHYFPSSPLGGAPPIGGRGAEASPGGPPRGGPRG